MDGPELALKGFGSEDSARISEFSALWTRRRRRCAPVAFRLRTFDLTLEPHVRFPHLDKSLSRDTVFLVEASPLEIELRSLLLDLINPTQSPRRELRFAVTRFICSFVCPKKSVRHKTIAKRGDLVSASLERRLPLPPRRMHPARLCEHRLHVFSHLWH
jgi:hypothetical protein